MSQGLSVVYLARHAGTTLDCVATRTEHVIDRIRVDGGQETT